VPRNSHLNSVISKTAIADDRHIVIFDVLSLRLLLAISTPRNCYRRPFILWRCITNYSSLELIDDLIKNIRILVYDFYKKVNHNCFCRKL
jgi:hypothetical protein